jgi:hypothetical protein
LSLIGYDVHFLFLAEKEKKRTKEKKKSWFTSGEESPEPHL